MKRILSSDFISKKKVKLFTLKRQCNHEQTGAERPTRKRKMCRKLPFNLA